MKSLLLAYGAGLVFGLGLLVSGMTLPAKVLAFLDVASGAWDPSLAFVMVGAIGVHLLAYRLVPRLPSPLFATAWQVPTRTDIDASLIGGGVLFGVGWGLSGYCPGPAIVALGSLRPEPALFVAAMIGGMAFHYAVIARPAQALSADLETT